METGIAPENKKRSHDHGTHHHPAPHAARSVADTATIVTPAAGDSPTLAALSAEPGGDTVAVIVGPAGIRTAAAR